MMKKPVAILLSVLAAASVTLAYAETFPSRTVKIIVAYPPGGPTDTIGRVATQGLGETLGQSVIIENVSGAGGRVGGRDVARATPDGYTLLLGGSNDNAITPLIYSNLDYSPAKDLTAVAALAEDSNAIVVNPAVPAHTLAELASYAKANPGKLTAGSTVGIAPHILLAYFLAKSGADIVFVPYKGAAPAMADVLGNQIQVFASAKSVLLPLAQAGKLRILAVTSAQRWPELPDVPTMRESGYDAFPDPGVVQSYGAGGNAARGDRETQRRSEWQAEAAGNARRYRQIRSREPCLHAERVVRPARPGRGSLAGRRPDFRRSSGLIGP